MNKAISILFLVALMVGMAHAQPAISSTTTSAAATATQGYVMVASATNITAPNGSNPTTMLLIDREAMYVTSVVGTRIGVIRGVAGTIARQHASGALVIFGAQNAFDFAGQIDPVGPCTSTYTLAVVATGHLMKCSNSAWKRFDEGETVKASAQLDAVTGSTGTTLTNVSGLSASVTPGTYKFYVHLPGVTTANAGVKYAFKYSTAPTSIDAVSKAFTASAVAVTRTTTATDQALLTDSAGGGAGPVVIDTVIEGTMVVSALGTVQLQAAQKAAHADTMSVYAGAYMTFTKIQ